MNCFAQRLVLTHATEQQRKKLPTLLPVFLVFPLMYDICYADQNESASHVCYLAYNTYTDTIHPQM